MVAPKHQAIAYEDREAIINAFNECHKAKPSKDSVMFLINLWNKFHSTDAMTMRSYTSCADCRIALRNFFKYVIEEWNKA